jgi:DNA-binding transcriptional LysR family regulator
VCPREGAGATAPVLKLDQTGGTHNLPVDRGRLPPLIHNRHAGNDLDIPLPVGAIVTTMEPLIELVERGLGLAYVPLFTVREKLAASCRANTAQGAGGCRAELWCDQDTRRWGILTAPFGVDPLTPRKPGPSGPGLGGSFVTRTNA